MVKSAHQLECIRVGRDGELILPLLEAPIPLLLYSAYIYGDDVREARICMAEITAIVEAQMAAQAAYGTQSVLRLTDRDSGRGECPTFFASAGVRAGAGAGAGGGSAPPIPCAMRRISCKFKFVRTFGPISYPFRTMQMRASLTEWRQGVEDGRAYTPPGCRSSSSGRRHPAPSAKEVGRTTHT